MAMFWTVLILLVYGGVSVTATKVRLEVLSRLFIPPVTTFDEAEDVIEQMAYDATTNLVYAVGGNTIHVVDVSDVTNLQVIYQTSKADVTATDVEICGGYVFVAFDNELDRDSGFVDVYKIYNSATDLEFVQSITVGNLPDSIRLTQDCLKLVVALEAEPFDDDATSSLIDPPGGVAIVTFSTSPEDPGSLKTLDFTAFDSKMAELAVSGVRHVYSENGNPLSNDFEPEYIAINEDDTKAFVSLQENNAILSIDLVTDEIIGIIGLGFKDWSNKLLDVSDKDDAINLQPWRVLGMYQPDGIAVYRHRGIDYIITANEGDSKDYDYWSEEVRVKDYSLSALYEPDPTVRDELEDDENLGRLKVTTVNGFNSATGEFDTLYSYGARSFSIWEASTMTQLYDSGSDIAVKTVQYYPDLFNGNNGDADDVVKDRVDSRSDDKGAEPEGIELASVGGTTLVFVCNERPGTIAVYSINERSWFPRPRFQTMLADVPRTDVTWSSLYDGREVSMLDCEDMKFVPAADSPNGENLLLVSGAVSGTITAVQVNIKGRQ